MPTSDSSTAGHLPVLPGQVLSVLAPRAGAVCLDCTLGRGGHAGLILPSLGPGGRYIGLDLDPGNIAFCRENLAPAAEAAGVRLDLVHGSFARAPAVLRELGAGPVDLLLADLGFASTQMDDPARGLSFMRDGPLDMRLDPTRGQTAAELIAALPERELADLIYRLGEERLSRRIARIIVERRRREPILTTWALADAARQAYGARGRRQRIDPATRTFMALRIAVNGELEALQQLLACLPTVMAPGGAAAVISFHSLEDRLVKQAFSEGEKAGLGRRLTRKPLVADEAETAANPRSRSAKLRAFRFGTAAANADESDGRTPRSPTPTECQPSWMTAPNTPQGSLGHDTRSQTGSAG